MRPSSPPRPTTRPRDPWKWPDGGWSAAEGVLIRSIFFGSADTLLLQFNPKMVDAAPSAANLSD